MRLLCILGLFSPSLVACITNEGEDLRASIQLHSVPVMSSVATKESNYEPIKCSELSANRVICRFNSTCVYGQTTKVPCWPLLGTFCDEDRDLQNITNATLAPSDRLQRSIQGHYRVFTCMYCYQATEDVVCHPPESDCNQPGVARSYYIAYCSVGEKTLCLGRRTFYRMMPCHKPSGKAYGVAVTLSLFLGGLGADRFYLGMWREGLGKLFTFGGLGVWSLLDFFLVVVGFVRPQDDLMYGHDP